MSIDFAPERWHRIVQDYTAWWAGELARPLIHIELTGAEPRGARPTGTMYEFTACYGPEVTPEVIADHWDYRLSCKRYVGDAYPNIRPNFGAGVNAAFMGARAIPTETTVWFEPPAAVTPDALHFTYQPDHPWLRRIVDICRTAGNRWQGAVCIGMTDLNNGIDPVARFFSSEAMLLALYDAPDEVKRLTWQSHELMWRYYDQINAASGDTNPGYTCWGGLFSKVPHFVLQSDFSAMISPRMFETFILPELAASCRRIPNAFYHLDGPGELPHLDMILAIPELKGVQWIPGTGHKDEKHWPELYQRIRDAGKLIQVFGGFDTLDALTAQLGSAEGIYLQGSYDISQESWVRKELARYGAE
jgi:hypothetical protein